MKLKQTNKNFKCPNCKNVYLEPKSEIRHNGYCNMRESFLLCNNCYGEFEVEE